MGKTKHGMLRALEENIDHFTGEEIKKKVMEGSEEITERPVQVELIQSVVSGAKECKIAINL